MRTPLPPNFELSSCICKGFFLAYGFTPQTTSHKILDVKSKKDGLVGFFKPKKMIFERINK